MRKLRKLLSVILSLCLVITSVAITPLSASAKAIYYGDANDDGEVTIADAYAIQCWLTGISGINEEAADADDDGGVNVRDATCIQQYLAGFSNCGRVGQRIDGEPVYPEDEQPEMEYGYSTPYTVTLIDWDGTKTVKEVEIGDEITVYTYLNTLDSMLYQVDIREKFNIKNRMLEVIDYPVAGSETAGENCAKMFPVVGDRCVYNLLNTTFRNHELRMNYTHPYGAEFQDGSLLMQTTYRVTNPGNSEIRILVQDLCSESLAIEKNRKTSFESDARLYSTFEKEDSQEHETEGPTDAPATEPTENETEAPTDSGEYYLVGDMTNWAPVDAYKLSRNFAAEGEEYVISCSLTNGSGVKVAKAKNGTITDWYPGGMGNDYKITVTGEYDVYFRPNADGGSDWYYNYLYVTLRSIPGTTDTKPTTETPVSETPTAAPETVAPSSESCEHNYVATVVPPNCMEQGYTEYCCEKCHDTYRDNYTPIGDHTPGEWEIVEEATVLNPGLKVKKCTKCGEELERENIPRLQRQPTLVGNMSTREIVDPEEIKALGIDTTAPENSIIYECNAKLTYSATGEDHPAPDSSGNKSINFYTNGAGRIVGFGGSAGYIRLFPPTSSGSSSGSSAQNPTGGSVWFYDKDEQVAVQPLGSNGDEENPSYYYLCLEGYGSVLKQVFSVSLMVMNTSDELWYEDCEAEINLPDGLSLADMMGDIKNTAVKKMNQDDPGAEDGFIDKKGKGSVTWYVRGDNEGSYDITVNVSGKIYPEPYDEFDDLFFKTEEPIEIQDSSEVVKLTLSNVPYKVDHGQTVDIGFTMTNISDRILNGIVLEIKGGDREELDYLEPEESVTVTKPITFNFASMDKDEITYYLENIIFVCNNNFPIEFLFSNITEGSFSYSLAAYDDREFNNQVKDVVVSEGSFSWRKANPSETDDMLRTNYDKLFLKLSVSIKDKGDLSPSEATNVSVELTAPDGFSFDPFVMNDKKSISIDRITKSESYVNTEDIILYPVYLESGSGALMSTVKVSAESFKDSEGAVSLFNALRSLKDGRIELRNSFNKTGKKMWIYQLDMDLDGLKSSSRSYNHALSKLSATLAAASYQRVEMENTFRNLGFSNMRFCNYHPENDQLSVNEDQVACAFATKKIIINDEKSNEEKIYTLIAIAIRGTIEKEWYSNFRLGNGTIHQGFRSAYEYVSNQLEDYYEELQKFTNVQTDNNKILIGAHSRAGAAADLLATELNSKEADITGLSKKSADRYALFDNTYTYTFAAPNSTLMPIEYDNVYNIVNETDAVPHLPGVYRKSGKMVSVGDWKSLVLTAGQKAQVAGLWLINRESYESAAQNDSLLTDSKNLRRRMLWIFNRIFGVQDKNVKLNENSFAISGVNNLINELPADFVNATLEEAISVLLRFELKHPSKEIVLVCSLLIKEFTEYALKRPIDFTVGDWITERFVLADNPGEYPTNIFETRLYSNHSIEVYLSWLEVTDSLIYNHRFRRFELHCPVDVEVYDANNTLVCKVENDEVVYEDGCYCYIEGESKIFMVDSAQYTFRITGYDDGVMGVEVFEYGEDDSVSRYINYADITVTKGKTTTLSAGEKPEEDTAAYSLKLYNNTPVAADRDISGEVINSVTVSIDTVNDGVVLGEGEYVVGQMVTLIAIGINDEFVGWYQDGELISTDEEYSFVCEQDIQLEARFINLVLGDTDGDGVVSILDATAVQKKLANLHQEPYIEAAADTDGDGSISILDVTAIQRYLAYLSAPEGIGKTIVNRS